MASNEDVSSSEKLLFAVDLVDHVIVKTRPNFAYKTVDILEKVDRLRNYTCRQFSRTVGQAIDVIDVNEDASVHRDFLKMMHHKRVDKEIFTEYADSYRLKYFPESFNAKYFLKYCHHVADLAGYFLSYGVDEAPDYAVDLIMRAFPDGLMYSGAWIKVHNIARSYARIGNGYFGECTSSSESSGESTGAASENEDGTSSSRMETVEGSSGQLPSENRMEPKTSGPNLGECSNTSVLDRRSSLEMQDLLSSHSSDFSIETPSSPIID